MIIFDLQCPQGHRFEGWFEDTRAFETQHRQKLIACPVCNDTQVVRVPSTFAIKGKPEHSAAGTDGPQFDPVIFQKAVQHYVENNFDNVGADFAKEALKIHYGVSQPRNIRGSSTQQEEETLRKEGIEFYKFPMLDNSKETSDPDA